MDCGMDILAIARQGRDPDESRPASRVTTALTKTIPVPSLR